VLNKVTEYLVQNEMLPALCYVFSRKQLEKCAEELSTTVLEFDSKVFYTADRECEQIIRKLPNYEEYLHLPEYINLVKMIRRGVGIHHAGLMPILREMVELLFARGFIKILFCTETMSVGINLPVKTTIFTDINKYNGEIVRNLYSHEYTQAAGRAGRLGLDTKGHVIHLNNLFRNVDHVGYKLMMNGKPQILTSKFKISFNLLLNLLSIGDKEIVKFAEKSMVTNVIDSQTKEIYTKIQKLSLEIETLQITCDNLRTPKDIIKEYIDLHNQKLNSVNKKRKEIERNIQKISENYRNIDLDKISYNKLLTKEYELLKLESELKQVNNYLSNGVDKVFEILKSYEFVNSDFSLTLKGEIACQLKEIHSLVFATLINNKNIDTLSAYQIVLLLCCFTNVTVQEEFKSNQPKTNDKLLDNTILHTIELYNKFKDEEINNNVCTGADYSYHFDLLDYIGEWCKAENAVDCKIVLQMLHQDKGIFLGEFVKAILKINNIINEMEKIAEKIGRAHV
jgi:superfamily II RNA helicase